MNHENLRLLNRPQSLTMTDWQRCIRCSHVDLQAMVNVLLEHLSHKAVQTRVAVLRWIHHLHNTMPDRLFKYLDRLFPALLKLISDSSDEACSFAFTHFTCRLAGGTT